MLFVAKSKTGNVAAKAIAQNVISRHYIISSAAPSIGHQAQGAILAAVQGAADADARATYLSGIALDTAQVTDGEGAFMKSLDAGEAESLAARLVMFDASTIGGSEYFMISEVYDATFSKAQNYFDYDGDKWVNALDYSTAGAAGSNWQAVATSTPEPTSGLLLLLGVAGLALAAADAPFGLGLPPSAPSKLRFSLGRRRA